MTSMSLAEKCTVPGSKTEYFDCCTTPTECNIVGGINLAVVIVLVIATLLSFFAS